MKQTIGYVALVVRDYDEAIRFYVETLDFVLVEDTFIESQNKRWVLVAPAGASSGSGAGVADRQPDWRTCISVSPHR